LPQPVHRRTDTVLEFYDGVVGPEFLANLLPEHNLARMLQEGYQNSKRLVGEADGFAAISTQLAGPKVKLEAVETGHPLRSFGLRHTPPREVSGF
jgi:hypothetical protein